MAEYIEMPSTMWMVIAKARAGDIDELDRLLRYYRPPVLSFIRNKIQDADEAEDVTQEVFVTLVQDDVLARVDPSKGKFRTLLLSVARHVLSERRRSETAVKRGSGRKPISLDAPAGPSTEMPLGGLVPAPTEDAAFDALWVENLVRLAMARLRDLSLKEGTSHFDALFAHVNDGLAYADIAQKLGVTVTDVKNYVHQARLRLRRLVLQEIQSYSASRAEYEEEVAYLMKLVE
jgi:RNA polymerase sigma factor (sigma-70 family)